MNCGIEFKDELSEKFVGEFNAHTMQTTSDKLKILAKIGHCLFYAAVLDGKINITFKFTRAFDAFDKLQTTIDSVASIQELADAVAKAYSSLPVWLILRSLK